MTWKFDALLLLVMCCFCAKSEKTELIELIQEHQRAKKNFAIQDAYKLIYQGVLGVGHILDEPEMAKKYLEQEFSSIPACDDEKLIENISMTGEIVRINLRPYKFRNGNVEQLFQGMISSAKTISGSCEQFLSLWNEFKRLVLSGKLNFNKQELEIFDNDVKKENYPAMHHSPAYHEANQPAYRVLKKSIAETLLKAQNIEY